jgi:hypothetical protein
MDQKTFIKTLRSWQNGSISRREFLGRTGLGIAAAVVATHMPGLLTSTAEAAEQGKLGIACRWRPGRTTTARKTSTRSPRPPARGCR